MTVAVCTLALLQQEQTLLAHLWTSGHKPRSNCPLSRLLLCVEVLAFQGCLAHLLAIKQEKLRCWAHEGPMLWVSSVKGLELCHVTGHTEFTPIFSIEVSLPGTR